MKLIAKTKKFLVFEHDDGREFVVGSEHFNGKNSSMSYRVGYLYDGNMGHFMVQVGSGFHKDLVHGLIDSTVSI